MTSKKKTPNSENSKSAPKGAQNTKQAAAKAAETKATTKAPAKASAKTTTKSSTTSTKSATTKASKSPAKSTTKASSKAKVTESVAADTKAVEKKTKTVEGEKGVSESKQVGTEATEKTKQTSAPAAEKAASEVASSQQEVRVVTEKQSGNGIGWLGVFLGLGGLALAGYTYMSSQVVTSKNEGALTRLDDFNSQTTELRQTNDAIQANLNELKGEAAGFGSRFDAIDSKFGDVDAKFGDVDNKIGEVSQSVAAAKQGLDDGLAAMQSNLGEMETGIDERFSEQVTKLEDDYGRIKSATSAFQMKEVQALTDMAQERLILADDVGSAKRALKVADNKLAEIDDSGLLPLRQQIQQSIADLDQAEVPDVADLVTRLAGAVQSINSLPLAEMGRIHPTAESVAVENEKVASSDAAMEETTEEAAPDATEETAASESSGEWWKTFDGVTDKVGGALDKAGTAVADSLEDVIVVHDVSETATPLMEPNQRYFLKENLRMAVQNTEYALIRGYGEAAAASAKSAQDILSQYFVGDNEQVQNLNSLLEEAATINLTATIPDISATVEAVKAAANQ